MATTKPLRILVHPKYLDLPWAQELRAAGNTVEPIPAVWGDYDVILAPEAARFLPGMEKFLPAFLKGARKIRYDLAKGKV